MINEALLILALVLLNVVVFVVASVIASGMDKYNNNAVVYMSGLVMGIVDALLIAANHSVGA